MEGGNPVFVVMGAEGVHAHGGSDFDVAGAVVDEKGFAGLRLLAAKHDVENLAAGFHDLALIAEVEGVEEIADGVALAIEIAVGPLHHEGVGVGQQADFVALAAQVEDGLQIAAGNMVDIAVPSRKALVHGQRTANK